MTAEPGRIGVLLADEQGLFRETVRIILGTRTDLEVLAEAGDGASAVEAARKHHPDVALISLGLDGYEGLAVVRSISQTVPTCRVVVLAPTEDAAALADAMEAGASGYLSKERPVTDLVETIRAVDLHGILIPQSMLSALIRGLVGRRREREEAVARYEKLTSREREVLELLIQGADNESIGRTLLISPQTARTHVQNILAKLRVHSRLEAAAFVRKIHWRELMEPAGTLGSSSTDRSNDDVA
jgi:DNA-binding NarL/FixJ family response regulator